MAEASSWYAVLDADGVVLATIGGTQDAVEELAGEIAGAQAVRPVHLEGDEPLPAPGHRWDRDARTYVGEPAYADAPTPELEETS